MSVNVSDVSMLRRVCFSDVGLDFFVSVYKSDDYISSTIVEHNVWEPFQTALELRILSDNGEYKGAFVDIGANIGWHSIATACALAAQGRVYSFEPHPLNASLICQSATANNMKNIYIENVACSSFDGAANLYLGGNSAMGTHSLFQVDRSDSIEAKVITLDRYFKDRDLPEGVVVIKIDTEGSERHVLEGAEKFFARIRGRSAVFIELNFFHETHVIDDGLFIVRYLENFGIAPYGISPSRYQLFPLSHRYLEDSIIYGMKNRGKFYGDFLFCGEGMEQKVEKFLWRERDAIKFN